MDNIVYTSAITLMIGVFYSAVRHMHNLYFSNTRLIIRQSDQIQFLLVRIIELDQKIKKMNQERDDLANINDSLNTLVLDTIEEEEEEEEEEELLTVVTDEEEEEKEKEKEIKENNLNKLDEILTEEKEKEKEITFEIVETAIIKTQKEKGWIRYLF